MNFSLFKPYSLLFYTTLILGIFISLSSNNWFAIWIGLELNIYSFIPLLLQSNINQEKEAAIKYFLIQALASGIILLASLSNFSFFYTFFLFSSLIIKLALAPCHFWFPSVINSLSWKICWLLTTLQKVAPLYILTQTINFSNFLIPSFVAAFSALVGGIGGLNQTQIRAILAYSSIGHLGWILASSLISLPILTIYFLSYLIIISSIIFLLNSYSIYNASPTIFYSSELIHKTPFLPLLLLSLGGLPPLFGFFPKLLLLFYLVQNSLIFLPFILILSSTINLYYYLKIVFLTFIQSPNPPFIFLNFSTYKSFLFTSIYCISLFSGLFLLIFLI